MNKCKGKNILKYIIKILISIFILLYIAIAPITVFPLLKQSQGMVNQEIQIDYMGILELWNVDTFEGGSVSRTSFLQKRAMEFEKQHTGTFIMVQSMTMEQALLNIENGNLPDMISFGIGLGDEIVDYLSPINFDAKVRQDLISAGKFNNVQLAVPFILGGYTIINETNSQFDKKQIINSLGCGMNGCNNGLLALSLDGYTAKKLYENNSQLDTFSAYDKYLDKKFDCLLGTQRDLYRVLNRIEKGNMTARSFCDISSFTDLVQYIAISSKDNIKKEISSQFVKYLLSDVCQQKLSSINMFSVNNSGLYCDDEFASMERALDKPLSTLNVFLTQEKLEEIKLLSVEAVQGNSSSLAQLKKYLV